MRTVEQLVWRVHLVSALVIVALVLFALAISGCSRSRQDTACDKVCAEAEHGLDVRPDLVEWCGCF